MRMLQMTARLLDAFLCHCTERLSRDRNGQEWTGLMAYNSNRIMIGKPGGAFQLFCCCTQQLHCHNIQLLSGPLSYYYTRFILKYLHSSCSK